MIVFDLAGLKALAASLLGAVVTKDREAGEDPGAFGRSRWKRQTGLLQLGLTLVEPRLLQQGQPGPRHRLPADEFDAFDNFWVTPLVCLSIEKEVPQITLPGTFGQDRAAGTGLKAHRQS